MSGPFRRRLHDRHGRKVLAIIRGGELACALCLVPLVFETVTTTRFTIYGAQATTRRRPRTCACDELPARRKQ
ncbi:MAG: hypothetical protein M3167_06210 [Acidobacteriota bacterium]|nr:hypothetical protein [Acidobacteriota bacterium]MDQ6892258.1 hypothetical protein [Acidobacteriota bacterium]